MNVRPGFKSVLFLFLFGSSVLMPTKSRSDYLNDLFVLRVPGIQGAHSFQSMFDVSNENIALGVRELLIGQVDYYDGEILNKFFRIFKSAQKERAIDCQNLGQAVLDGLRDGCAGQLIFLFNPEIAQKIVLYFKNPDLVLEPKVIEKLKEKREMFDAIVINKNPSQFCDFLQLCQKIKKVELQGMTGRQYAKNLGRLFIEALLREFFKTRNIEGIDKMACALLGFCSEVEPFSFQDDVFSKLRDYFLAKIQSPNFLSIEFPAETAKLVSAFSSSAEEFKMCSICTSPMILFVGAPNCNPSSLCHPYCLNQNSCHFCRGISGITCRPPRVRETLPALESRPHSGSRTVTRPNPKKTRGVSVAPAARRSPSPSRVGIRGIQSRQGRGLPRVGA